MKTLPVICLCTLLTACVTAEQRLNNRSERTLLSAKVHTLLDESNGTLDTREHADVGCERIRIVGSHLVTRFCYTSEEDKEMGEKLGPSALGAFREKPMSGSDSL